MSADVIDLTERKAGAASATGIARTIRDRITSGDLALGARISDKKIAADLGVSRTPVREALVQLQSEGLVTMRPQSGTYVFDLSADDVRQICAARAILETGALRLGAGDVPADDLARLGLLVGRASIALSDGDLAHCDRLDCAFHEALVAISGNTYLIKAYARIADSLRALRQRMPRNAERMARAIEQHRHIVDLWAAGRIDHAATELAAHFVHVERLLSAVGANADDHTAG